MTDYHLAGLASAFFVTLALSGLVMQVRFIRKRKRLYAAGQMAGERPTSTISLNRFTATYLGFYALFAYGLFLEELNHYLVWPRVAALAVALLILHAIMTDRRGALPVGVFAVGAGLFVMSPLLRWFGGGLLAYSAFASQVLVVAAAALFLQGAVHQVVKIRRAGRTGGLSLPMHQLFFVKDCASIWFGFTMGAAGWPLLLFNGVSLVMQCVLMWHFRWTERAPAAAQRRAAPAAD
ncbi:MAG: hypothetical protein OXU96_07840 [Gammaproteobacteria bacterium]|nr:hypothetical protein [Gammaproteobacteria bacterium]